MRFQHPLNGHTVSVTAPEAWTLLFGPLYFASHGVWSHAVISAVVALFTAGVSWLVYPWFARKVVRASYLSRGWRDVTTAPPQTA